jgi:hypothetical protein
MINIYGDDAEDRYFEQLLEAYLNASECIEDEDD